MDVRQLAALVAIADHGTFSAAARALFTVQSNVSSHIARLERELGTTLVDRAHGGLTDDGAAGRRAGPADPPRDGRHHRRRGPRRRPGHRRRAPRHARHDGPLAAPPPARRRSTTATRTCGRSSPRAARRSLIPGLLAGRFSAAVVHLPVDDPELTIEPLFAEDLARSSPTPTTRWPARGELPLTEVADHRLLLPPAGLGAAPGARPGRRARSACSCRPRPRSTACACSPRSPSTATARRSSRRPRCRRSVAGRFGVVRVPELPPRVVALAYQRRPPPSAPTRALFDVLRDVVAATASRGPPRHRRVPAQPRRRDDRPPSPSPAGGRLPIVAVGVAAGFLAGLFGVGGGILIVPASSSPPGWTSGSPTARRSPRCCRSRRLAPDLRRHGNVDWDVARCGCAIGAVAGAVVGTHLLHVLPHRTLVAAVRRDPDRRRRCGCSSPTDADGRAALVGASAPRRCVARRARHRHPRRAARRRRRHRHGAGDDPAVRHRAGRRQGHVGGGDHPDRGDGHVAQPRQGQRRPAGGGDRRRAGIVTAALGGTLADNMSDDLSNVLFATLLLAVAARLLWQLHRGPDGADAASGCAPCRRSVSAAGRRRRSRPRSTAGRRPTGRVGRARRDDGVGLPRRAAVVDDVVDRRDGRRTARAEGMPLVVVLASTGADIVEGIAALEGWGRLAKALVDCSGDRADDRRRRRPGGVRTGAAARRRRPRRDDRGQLRLRQRAGDGRGVHRRAGDDRRARRRRRAGPPHRRAEPRRRRPRGGRRGRRRPARLPARRASTTTRRGGRPTTRSTGCARRPAR